MAHARKTHDSGKRQDDGRGLRIFQESGGYGLAESRAIAVGDRVGISPAWSRNGYKENP